MEEKFGVGDRVLVDNGGRGVPAEVVKVGRSSMRKVLFSTGGSRWVPVDRLSMHKPKFKVGDEVRSSLGEFPHRPATVEAVDLLSNGTYRYTIGGVYLMENKLQLSEYKFKINDKVLVKDTLQVGTVVGRKLMTDGKQDYTVTFPDGPADSHYAEELAKEEEGIKVGDTVRVKRHGEFYTGTVLSALNGFNGSKRYTVQTNPEDPWFTLTCTAEELAEWAEAPHRLQAAVDAVDVQSAELQKQVEAAQAKLTLLSQTKTVLLDMIREDAVGS